ncbi:MAG: hypothetical protein HPY66_3107 [Firmicutes bacterium]|nr:hypothetical protein [Bacillota bacterium]MDI6706832.1 hypothetical protein [Bacillota bacterium]
MKYKLKRGNVYYVEDYNFRTIIDKILWLLNMKLKGWKVIILSDEAD